MGYPVPLEGRDSILCLQHHQSTLYPLWFKREDFHPRSFTEAMKDRCFKALVTNKDNQTKKGVIRYEHQTVGTSQMCDIFNKVKECHEISKITLVLICPLWEVIMLPLELGSGVEAGRT